MPTESKEINPGKLLYKDQEGNIKELSSYEFKEENCNDDAIDAIEYAVKAQTDGEISISLDVSKDSVRKVLKIYGLERITRKRFKKLLMGCGIQRNDAEVLADHFGNEGIPYTPLAVQRIIETIIREMEKE